MPFSSKYICEILISQKLWENFTEHVHWKLSVFSRIDNLLCGTCYGIISVLWLWPILSSPYLFPGIYTLLLGSQFTCHLMGDQRGWRCWWGWEEGVLWSSGVYIILKPYSLTLTPPSQAPSPHSCPTDTFLWNFSCAEQTLTFISAWIHLKQPGARANTTFFFLSSPEPH